MIASFAAVLVPSTAPFAAASSVTFRQACERQLSDLEAEARAMVADWQKTADVALARHDIEEAARALEASRSLTVNVAGYSGEIFVKCLGEPTNRSFFKTRYRLYQLEAHNDPANTRSVIQAALFDAVNNPGKDANSVLASIPVEPRAYRSAMDTCEANLDLINIYHENGALVLSEEQALGSLSKKVIDLVVTEAKRQARTALTNEDTEFNRPATQQEKDSTANLTGVGEMAQAMAGVEIDDEMSPQLMTLNRQVNTSREWLRKANAWEFKSGETSLSFTRAEKRGDTLLARANDKTQDLGFRDQLYDNAQQYYEWCNCNDKAARAKTAHDAIRPALEARQEQQRQQLEEAQSKSKQKAEGMKEAVDNMKKTEAEKQQFKKEADKLEEELGF